MPSPDTIMVMIVLQSRYLHGLRGEWPTSIGIPWPYDGPSVRVPVYPKVEGRFHQSEMSSSYGRTRLVEVRVALVRGLEGFWAARFASVNDPIIFWPAPRGIPKWWEGDSHAI